MPRQSRDPMGSLHFRAPVDLLEAARTKAAASNENLSDVLRAALERYVKRG